MVFSYWSQDSEIQDGKEAREGDVFREEVKPQFSGQVTRDSEEEIKRYP
jgi:hypothetical protein